MSYGLIIFAAVALVACVAGVILTSPVHDRPRNELRGLRIGASMLSGFFGVVGLILMVDSALEPGHSLASSWVSYIVLGLLPLGSALYIAGVSTWSGRRAFVMRLAGWIAMIVPLAVSMVLALGLPLLAMLAVTLRRIETREPRPGLPAEGQPA